MDSAFTPCLVVKFLISEPPIPLLSGKGYRLPGLLPYNPRHWLHFDSTLIDNHYHVVFFLLLQE